MLTAYGTVETAVEAMKLGAFDYVLKPFDLDALEVTIRKALEHAAATAPRTASSASSCDAAPRFENLVGGSPRDAGGLRPRSGAWRRRKSAVLITGETGTGKELVARAIHDAEPAPRASSSSRSTAPRSRPSCSRASSSATSAAPSPARRPRRDRQVRARRRRHALPRRDRRHAVPLQAKLLRVLQEGVIERVGSNKRDPGRRARRLARRNRDLAGGDAATGRFREDLFYRLNVFHIAAAAAARAARGHPAARRVLPRAASRASSASSRLRSTPDGGRACSSATPGRATCASCRT